jgi:tRNA (guanine-N7-)-methyltransferase
MRVNRVSVTSHRQLLGINLDHVRLHRAFMGHDGQMHTRPGVGTSEQGVAGHYVSSGKEVVSSGKEVLPGGPVTAFRARRAALSGAQRETWERLWPGLGMSLGAGSHPDTGPLDTRGWFGRDAPLVLEIGCGSGTSTLAMATDEPHIDVIAVEVYRRGLAQLLCAIDRAQVTNIRLIRGEAIYVLQRLIPPASLTGVRVFFPDPWPKARHHKRRLLQPATLALIGDRLRPGGVLHVATDHAGYAEQIAEVGDAEPRLRRVEPGAELPISVVRPSTKYETKAQDVGSAVVELIWKKPEN